MNRPCCLCDSLENVASVGSASAGGAPQNPASPDALIIGHYGFRNLGDEAILTGMLSLLRETVPDGRWMVVSGDPEDTRERHGVMAVDRADVPAVLSEAYRSRVVIVGGGGLLSDQWGFRPEYALSRAAGDIPGYLGPALAAAAVGRPVLVWGVGVGPFRGRRSRRWVKALAEIASDFTVRTEEDRAELESIGIRDSQVVGDPAWLIQPLDLPPDLSGMLSHLPRPLVGVAPRSWGSARVQARREQMLAEALDGFCEENGGSVVFVPMQELEGDDFDDRGCCQRIADLMSAPDVHMVPPGLDPAQLLTVLGRCELALNMRLHGTILAALGGTPSVSISYDPKVTRLAGELGLSRFCLSDEEGSWSRLTEALDSVWEDYPDLSFAMHMGSEAMRASARSGRPVVKRALSGVSEADPFTDHQAIQMELMFALTRNLSGTQTRLDENKADNLELRNRIIRGEDKLQLARDELELARETARVELQLARETARVELQLARETARVELQAAYDQHAHAERRGDLLQLELDNFRQTRAIKLVTKYWRIRHRLRQKTARIITTPEIQTRSSSDSPESQIPEVVTDRVAESKGVVIFLLTIEWYIHLFQRPQQLAQAFARLGYTVIYDNSNQSRPGFEEIEPRLFLYNGPQEVLHHLPDPLVWAITYNWERASRYPEGTRTVYDWIDEIDVFDGYDLNKLKRLHSLGLADAGMITASARSLLGRANEQRPDALYLPNAVEFEHFANWRVSSPAHPILERFLWEGRPIAGYYGAIARWLDYDLLTQVAAEREDWSFLLIGPPYDQSTKDRSLFTLPNVEWVTAQPYQDLPRWLQSFDVAMIPFVVNEITESTSPLKLFEYFAGGKPVVCSQMPEVVAFPEVRSYCDAAGMSEALDLALADSRNAEVRNSLRQRGEQNSWLARARTVVERIEQGGR